MAECSTSSEFLSDRLLVLPKKKMETLISQLREVKREDLLSHVYRDVGSGYHLKHYPERQAFWDACIQTRALDLFVNALFDEYLGLIVSLKGREKYASLQLQWMELLRCIQHEHTCQKASSHMWSLAVSKVDITPSKPTECAIITSVGRAVFSFCQQHIVAMKEGESPLLEEEKELDEIDAAGLTADEASLYRLGGFALYSLMKSKNVSQEMVSILKSLRLPLYEKVELPSNIQHLDKGGMTFMKKELLGYIGMVCVLLYFRVNLWA